MVLVLAACPFDALGQVTRLTTGFQSDASRYVWTAGIDLNQRGRDWSFFLTNGFRSEAFLLSKQVNEFRDENDVLARLSRRVSPSLAAVGFADGTWYSQNSSSNVEGYGGLHYSPRPYVYLEPAAGMAIDRKPGLLKVGQLEPDILADVGPAVSLAGAITDRDVGGFIVGARTDNRWQFINPRFGRSLRTNADVFRTLEDGNLRVDVHFGDLIRESYQASSFLNRLEGAVRSDESIEATQSDTLDAGLQLEYGLGKNWRLVSNGSFLASRRFIRTLRAPEDELFFDTDFNREVADIQLALSYDDGRSNLRLTGSRSFTSERRRLANAEDLPPGQAAQKSLVLRQADFDRSVLWAQAVGSHALSRWLTVRGSYRASILRHDTPIANLDDRDESVFDADFGLLFYVRRNLQFDVRLFGVEHHTVYLDGSRSGENHKRRSLRLVPGVRWNPDRQTEVSLLSEVRAVYTTDDFTFPDQPKNDQSARELKYAAAFSRNLGESAALHLDGSLSRLLLGRLLWEDFQEIPFDTLETTSGWARLEVGRRWRAEFGVRAFYRSEYERSLTVRYTPPGSDGTLVTVTRPGRKRLLQIGPTGSFSLTLSKRSELRMLGWVQFQQTRLTLYGDLPPDDADAIREAGLHAERRTIPNLTISVLWNL